MQRFQLSRAKSAHDAISIAASGRTAQQGAQVRFLAGGTTLLDLMKLDVEQPQRVIDISRLPLDQIDTLDDGSVRIGATVRNADLATDPRIEAQFPVLSQALLAGASAQLRNMATTGGNLLQRTRCVYFRNTAMPCNKREPGSGCSALHGFNRTLAILGTSEHCIASNPSDMNVALTALDAVIHVEGVRGSRDIPIDDFFLLPGATPECETVLDPGELITYVTVPPLHERTRSLYLKLRDRASYEFALASAAVVLRIDDGIIAHARVGLGGVGTKPWHAIEAEHELHGTSADPATFARAADAALANARPASENGFKVELARRCLIHALTQAAHAPSPAVGANLP